MHPKKRPAQDMKAPATAEAIERGRYLANHVAGCVPCHSPGDVTKPGDPTPPDQVGAGRDFGNLPGFPGHVRASNISPDKAHGLGDWTDGEIVRAMREGVDRAGRPLFPMMPYGTLHEHLSDDDALAIVAYLRSLPAQANDPGPMVVDFPVSMFVRLAPRPLDQAPPPTPSDKLARGRWLLRMALCHDCHTPSDGKGHKLPGKEYAGGGQFQMPGGGILYTPNITSDKATGVGSHTDDDLLRVLNEGVNKAGRTLYMMPWQAYKGMTDDDKRALVAALREVPAVTNVVPASTYKP
jgi:mono/diheme cytochrome c family protein